MSKGLPKNYTFNTAAKTITLTDVTTVRLDKLALITDVTTNKIIYNFADSTVATATVATNVITLSALQGGEANGDKLRIDYDVESSDTAAFADTTQPVSAATLPLPTGASTSALQTTGNSSLSSIDTKTPALGQALAAASTPVVLTAAQVSTLTPQTNALTDTQLRATPVPVSGTVTTGGLTDTQLRATPVPVSGTVAVTGVATETTLAALNTKVATAKTFDLDSGVGTDTVQALGLAVAASGGSVAITGDAANGLDVDVTRLPSIPAGTNNIGDVDVLTINGVAPAFGTGLRGATVQRVTVATDDVVPISAASLPLPTGAATSALQTTQDTSINTLLKPASTLAAVTTVSTVTNLAQLGGAAVAMGTGLRSAGTQRVTIATDDVVPAAQSGTWTVQPGNTQNTTEWLVIDKATTAGGLSKAHLVSAATTNATSVKASAGQVYAITAFNLNASPRYLKLHNTAAVPTVGSGVTDTFLIPGNTSGAGLVLNIDKGIAFSTGIAFTLVTGIADADTAAVAASEIVLNIYYK